MRKIKQNLFWALIYNCIMIPLAAVGILAPALAGAAMAGQCLESGKEQEGQGAQVRQKILRADARRQENRWTDLLL